MMFFCHPQKEVYAVEDAVDATKTIRGKLNLKHNVVTRKSTSLSFKRWADAMNASLRSTSQPCSSRGDGRKSRRRTHCCALFLATALICDSSNGCDAFIVPQSRTRGREMLIDCHRKQSPFTKRKRTRTRHRDDVYFTKQHASQESIEIENFDHEDNTTKAEDAANTTVRTKWGHDNGKSSVYDDLEKLERAITLEDADLKLHHLRLQEQVEFKDQSKRMMVPDILRFLVLPLFYAFGLYSLLLSRRKGLLAIMGRFFTRAMDLHFWAFVVGAPSLLNACKLIRWRRNAPFRDQMPDELKYIDQDLAAMLGTSDLIYDDPRTSCDDTVSFLLEYWTSAFNGMALLHAGKAIATRFGVTAFQSSAVMLWLSCTQMFTRLAVVVALYQYPEKMYDLERSEFTRPVGIYPTVMLKLVRWMMVFAPLGLISDASKVLLHLPKGFIYPLYASIAVYLVGTWTRMQEAVSSNKDPLGPARLKPPKPLVKLVYRICFLALWRNQLWLPFLRKWLPFLGGTVDLTGMWPVFCILVWKIIGVGFLGSLSMLGPLIHIKAFSKIFEVEYTNDLPSFSTKESREKAIKERPERAYDMAWRHSIVWREPQRLVVSKGLLYDFICFFFFVKGGTLDGIDKARSDEVKWICENKGNSIKERVQRDLDLYEEGRLVDKDRKPWKKKGRLLNEDRKRWKENAMRMKIVHHESSYKTKRFEDPLGVAVYKAFGIGLGYNFDHMSELGEGEEPTPRRLQARAAKSAVRRYNELNDAEKNLVTKMNESKDPNEREHYQKLLEKSKKKFDKEIKYLAGRLKELIPTTSTIEEFGLMDTTKFRMKPESTIRKVSPDEYRKLEEDPLGFDEKSIGSEIV